MNVRERNLVKLGLVLALVTFIVRVGPSLYSWRVDKVANLASVKARINRLDNLLARGSFWRQKVEDLTLEQKRLGNRIFYGDTPEIISARVQGTIKKIAQKAGVTINSLSLPEFSRADSWLLISHTISLEGSANQVFDFFQKLQVAPHKLPVVEVNLRASGNLLRGALKITSFSLLGKNIEQ